MDSFFSPVGMCFSPDSRLLYVSAGFDLVQYRVDTSYILASYSLVDSINLDAKVSKLNPLFYMMLIAPDGKIYMNTTNSTEVFHVIHKPNLRGLACDFRQNDLVLPVIMYQNLPNFPHYRTYDWEGSGCDTLGITGPVSSQDSYRKDLRGLGFVIWMQDHNLLIKADQQVLGVEIINLQGQRVYYKKVKESEFEIPVFNLLTGIYVVKLYFKDHTTSFAKFVKD